MKHLIIVAAALLALTAAQPAMAADCYVNDPTGTPLNIRVSPNGHIVGTLGNDTPVSLLDQANHNGKLWAYVGDPDRRPLGWVFRDFVACEHASMQMPRELVGGWCYESTFPARYHRCPEKDVDGGESIIIRSDGYTSPEMQLNWGADPDGLSCRLVNIARDQHGAYTIDFNKCPNNSTERWVLRQLAPGHITIEMEEQAQ